MNYETNLCEDKTGCPDLTYEMSPGICYYNDGSGTQVQPGQDDSMICTSTAACPQGTYEMTGMCYCNNTHTFVPTGSDVNVICSSTTTCPEGTYGNQY